MRAEGTSLQSVIYSNSLDKQNKSDAEIINLGYLNLTLTLTLLFHRSYSTNAARADLGGGCRGCAPSPEMTCGFLIQLLFCKKKKNYVVYWC